MIDSVTLFDCCRNFGTDDSSELEIYEKTAEVPKFVCFFLFEKLDGSGVRTHALSEHGSYSTLSVFLNVSP